MPKGNVGSCERLANYLDKEIKGDWFGQSTENDSTKYVVRTIDKNGKGQLKKTDWKFCEVEYCPSFKEQQHLIKLATGRNVTDWAELTAEEQQKTKALFMDFVRKAQDKQAEHYQRKGISTGADLVWFGKIETQRQYKGFDKEVKQGKARRNEVKKGLHLHCHIIQSRKGADKKTILSPLSSNRRATTKNKIQQGFDRNGFKIKLEHLFDERFAYQRKQDETFAYANQQKKQGMQIPLHRNEVETRIKAYKNTTSNGKAYSRVSVYSYDPVEYYAKKGYIQAVKIKTGIINAKKYIETLDKNYTENNRQDTITDYKQEIEQIEQEIEQIEEKRKLLSEKATSNRDIEELADELARDTKQLGKAIVNSFEIVGLAVGRVIGAISERRAVKRAEKAKIRRIKDNVISKVENYRGKTTGVDEVIKQIEKASTWKEAEEWRNRIDRTADYIDVKQRRKQEELAEQRRKQEQQSEQRKREEQLEKQRRKQQELAEQKRKYKELIDMKKRQQELAEQRRNQGKSRGRRI